MRVPRLPKFMTTSAARRFSVPRGNNVAIRVPEKSSLSNAIIPVDRCSQVDSFEDAFQRNQVRGSQNVGNNSNIVGSQNLIRFERRRQVGSFHHQLRFDVARVFFNDDSIDPSSRFRGSSNCSWRYGTSPTFAFHRTPGADPVPPSKNCGFRRRAS